MRSLTYRIISHLVGRKGPIAETNAAVPLLTDTWRMSRMGRRGAIAGN